MISLACIHLTDYRNYSSVFIAQRWSRQLGMKSLLLKFQKKSTVFAALHYIYIYVYVYTCTWKVNILNEKSVEKEYLASLQDLKNLVPILPAKKF